MCFAPKPHINDALDLRVYRAPETHPHGPKSWRELRRGVADLYRRAELWRAANERYLTAMAAANDKTALAEEALSVCRAIHWKGRRYRALNPFEPLDAQLLEVVNRGDWAIKGFRNRDLRPLLYGTSKTKKEQRSQAAKVTRRLALLHAHGLIAKASHTHRWLVTNKGRRIITALFAARRATTEQYSRGHVCGDNW